MSYNVKIDDEQQDKFIRPIFEAIIHHVDDAKLIKIYFEVNRLEYSEYLPDHIMSDPQFVKEAIKRQLLDYSRVPTTLKNTAFITKDDYLNLVESRQVEINDTLYTQDKEIVLKGIKGIFKGDTIDPELRNDVGLMAQCIKVEERAWNYFNCQKELLENKDLVTELLIHNPDFFYKIPDEKRQEKYILKAMLNNYNGYRLLEGLLILKKIDDPELVLDALKISKKIGPIHQKFSSIINKHDAKKDPYNFLKTYLMMNSLESELDSKNKNPKNIKI